MPDARSFHLLAFAMTPASRGSVSLRSADPADPPRIDFRFLSDPAGADLALLRTGVDVMLSLAATPPLARRARPVADVVDALASDRDAYLAANVTGYAHAVGTCRMGAASDPGAVTDGSGLVRGTANVRVADASLMPVIPWANTNLMAMLVGWRVAGAVAAALG